MKRLVVTGSGLIGRALVRAALEESDVPIVVYGPKLADEFIDESRVTFHKGRLGEGGFASVLQDGDSLACCHGPARPRLSAAEFGQVLRSAVEASIEVVEAVGGQSEMRVVLFSSGGAVYGPTSVPATEDSQLAPESPYGSIKAAEEMIVRSAAREDVRITSLRCSTVYGTVGEAGRTQGLLNAAFAALDAGDPVTLFGDGSARRGYIHQRDLASIALTLLAADPVEHDVYNLCSGEYLSTRQVVALAADALGVEARFEQSDRSDVDVLIDPSRLFMEFPTMRATTPMVDGVAKQAVNFRNG